MLEKNNAKVCENIPAFGDSSVPSNKDDGHAEMCRFIFEDCRNTWVFVRTVFSVYYLMLDDILSLGY